MDNRIDLFDGKIKSGVIKISLSGKIITAAHTLPGMFGYSQEEMLALKCEDLLADASMFNHIRLKFQQHDELIDERILLRRKDNSNYWANLSLRLIKEADQIILTGIIEDISDLVSIESELSNMKHNYQKVKYELDRFIYSASHDIRSPLSSILGLINIMKLDNVDEKMQKYIELMDVSARRLNRFICELTTFAENAQRVVNVKQIDLEMILSEVVGKLKDHPSMESVKISYESDCNAIFSSDPFRIRLVLNQVIKNSLDYYDQNKSAPMISIQLRGTSQNVIIEVLDNGIGISKSHIGNVFDMFYRGTSLSKGSGLGLYVTHEAVTVLGGVISIHSEYGVGTSVKIELPNSNKGKVATSKLRLKQNADSRTIS